MIKLHELLQSYHIPCKIYNMNLNYDVVDRAIRLRLLRINERLSRKFSCFTKQFWDDMLILLRDLVSIVDVKIIGIMMSLIIINEINNHPNQFTLKYGDLNHNLKPNKSLELKLRSVMKRLTLRLVGESDLNNRSISLLQMQISQIKLILDKLKPCTNTSNMLVSVINVIDDII